MNDQRDTWLVAAWPGMGLVGHLAASHLARALKAQTVAEVPPEPHFEISKVETRRGLLVPARAPRTVLASWSNPGDGPDLLVLLGEAAPTSNVRGFCEKVLGIARGRGVSRVYTFAAMATPSPPEAAARVFAAATGADRLAELRGVEPLDEGEIGGMNGVFLAVAAELGLSGACLLGEFPYFASGVPNPKASAAVLRAFARLAGLRLDLDELDRQGEEVARQLQAHVQQAEDAARRLQESESGAEWLKPQAEEEPEEERRLAPREEARVESLFAEARRDRSRALALKRELDRLDVFERYEDRFLDLFKRAE
jgi:uncharacterized protein